MFAGNAIHGLYFIVRGFFEATGDTGSAGRLPSCLSFGCQHSRHESWKWRRRFLLLFIIGEIKLAKCSRQASITDNIGARHLNADDKFQWSGWKIQVKTGLEKKKKNQTLMRLHHKIKDKKKESPYVGDIGSQTRTALARGHVFMRSQSSQSLLCLSERSTFLRQVGEGRGKGGGEKNK